MDQNKSQERSFTAKQLAGNRSENAALEYLIKHGLKLRERNFQCLMGEIDLIMQEGNTMVFVEVRYRSDNDYGSALTTITQKKQHKIIQTATFYLQKKRLHDRIYCRFDVVAFDGKVVEWIRDAFQLPSP
jgi:putative endonuclease